MVLNISILFLILAIQLVLAQEQSNQIKTLEVDGYYRFFGFHRNVNNLYGSAGLPSVFQANDDFNSPSVNLNLKLTTSSKSKLNIQLFFFDPLNSINENKNRHRLILFSLIRNYI